MTFRIAQISDTHLSPDHPGFTANFHRLAAAVRESQPDLVLHTGDISLDGADKDSDLAFARAEHDAAFAGLDWRILPGNHDIGDTPAPGVRQPANAERLARWCAVFGSDRMVVDTVGWRILGLDALTMGADFPAAHEQFDAVAEAAAGCTLEVAVFLHKPLFHSHAAEDEPGYWYVPHDPRQRLIAALGRPPALVACGHVHQFRDHMAAGTRHIWAPATSFIVGDDWQEPIGTKMLGWVEHLLHPDGSFESHLRTVDALTLHDIGQMPHVYGAMAKRAG
ncbi:calcineurin-like phosphoesterase family protein [Humitalea rosea]|uniref:Calcineurin-like phosphoesterase family protein n=1 Tax=Humitalea rosea TaxID=990373 RepID=A0A2W7ITJ1_9PROT|nr:metallophosphoesterase [Humitalea rosea]PZW50524.1 calcineurin-like phosphoesterase family protein [Humitalea rosea]